MSRKIVLATVFCLTSSLLPGQQQLRSDQPHDSGRSVTPSFEGWFANADGTYSILFGYFNRNMKQELDLPIGPGNKIEPGGPDQGQPTHFMTRRQWGVFTVTLPKDFGSKKIVWTIVANGVTTAIPAGLDPLWEVSPFFGGFPRVDRAAQARGQRLRRLMIISLHRSAPFSPGASARKTPGRSNACP
jgi:hypothetical protein